MTLNMARDLVPLPPFQSRIVTDAQNDKWDNLGPRSVKGFVLHRMLGSLDGTDAYFRRGTDSTGLTDWGSSATSGRVYLWNSPTGAASPGASPNKSPWASGRFNVNGDAYGDGLAFVNKYGINAVNRDETAWEIDGNYDDPWSAASQAAAAQACAHYAHNYGITWEQFPIHPQDGFSFVRWHQEITGPREKICPGPVVMAATPAWIEQVRAIMRAAQIGDVTVPTTPKPPTQPNQPDFPNGMDAGIAAALFGEKTVGGVKYAFNPVGPLSLLWLADGKKTGLYPELIDVQQYKDSPTATRTYFCFSNGAVYWRPNDSAAVTRL